MDLGNELTCSYNMRNKEEKKILLTHCIVRGGEYIPVTRETFTQSSQMRWSFKATYQVAGLTTHIRTRIPFAHQWAMDTERFSYMIHTHPHKKKKEKETEKAGLYLFTICSLNYRELVLLQKQLKSKESISIFHSKNFTTEVARTTMLLLAEVKTHARINQGSNRSAEIDD